MSDSTLPALVKAGPGQEWTSVTDVAVRPPSELEAQIKVEACGLCGSDVHAWRGDDGYGWVKTPVVLGHELVGEVVAVGPGADSSWIGRRVVPIAIDGCQSCPTCATGLSQICPDRQVLGLSFDGGGAVYVSVPVNRLVEVDADAPALRMTLTEPMSVAARAVRHLGELPTGARVAVSGPGPIGMFTAWLLARGGVDVVLTGTERDELTRLPAARSLGITAVRGDLGELATPVDAWIEASGSSAGLAQAVESVTPGGSVVVVALFAREPLIPINSLVRGEINLRGSYGSLREDYIAAAQALALAPGFEDIVSTAFPLAQAIEALEATAAGEVVKAVLIP
ncbi:zinc-dependent alcohol dehydrogenase [Arthrobacter sp. TB 23]|uniref:zinc-dependent alcohol dehydrogenase n=1 Tax=Arthrobacter sp. TB 23 TaxID=494419 RepID=UPI00031364B8|nr:alcohol dehydrogenase catalytic domain-containing protein [Arthrobacter sp. TB 23]